MKIERSKNAARNIIFGMLLKVYQIVIPFILRTAMIHLLGVEYVGVNSLFISILQMLNLTELGVASAIVYSMYKPIAEDDKKTICALMQLYKKYYTIIGWVIAIIGGILTPFIPKLISGDVPGDLNIYVLYLMNLGITVLSYWLYAYKSSLIYAHQRTDIRSKIYLITSTIQYCAQIIVLFFFRSYYLFVIVSLLAQVLTNLVTSYTVNKVFPEYKPQGELERTEVKDINQRIKDLFTSRLGLVVVNSVDTIVISSFLGLTMLAIYQNYYYIIMSLIGCVDILFQACSAGIGNSLIVESKEKNFKDLKVMTFIVCWITGFCICCMLSLYQPFMEIWVGKDLMLEYRVVICLCIYFLVNEINMVLTTYKDSGGIWHRDRYRPLITAFVNLILNLILVTCWGIYGIILATILSVLLVGIPWLLSNLFSTMFDKGKIIEYIRCLALYIAVSVIVSIVCTVICCRITINPYLNLILRGILCCILSNVGFFIIYRNFEEFKESILLVRRIARRKHNIK